MIQSEIVEYLKSAQSESVKSTPIIEYIIKIASRCNLNCSYCYMYNLADFSYQYQPKFLSDEITQTLAEKIKKHAAKHNLSTVGFVLHGGEPLLYGKEDFSNWIKLLFQYFNDGPELVITLQSNGVLIDQEWVDILSQHDISIGISLDGPRDFHNIYRVDHSGRGSFDDVVAGIQCLQNSEKGRNIFNGILTVINTDIDPNEYYKFIKELDVPSFDVLLPHANYANLPKIGKIPFGDWMVSLFDSWFNDSENKSISMRLFQDIIHLALGDRNGASELLGNEPIANLIIETDGGIEPSDILKSCGDGFTKLGLNILKNEIDDIFKFPLINAAHLAKTNLCETCSTCHLSTICAGGRISDRWNPDNGFNNPSIYCADLMQLIDHIKSVIISSLSDEITQKIVTKSID